MNNENRFSLRPFFEAKSVAVLGASPNARKPNGRPVQYLLERGYRGPVYPVNPKYETVQGLKCYPSVKDIPGEVDLAVVGVAARDTLPLLQECVEKKVKGAVILTSGFGELGGEGRRLEEEITALARQSGMRIMGPNCIGMINNLNNLWASFALLPTAREFCYSKRFSLISQSGFFGAFLFEMAGELKINFDYFASVGNQADLSFTDFFDYIVEDPGSNIIVGYIEGLKDGRLFLNAAKRAWKRQKPVIAMKVGRTEVGARAVSSHTGSLAGSDRIYSAAFHQAGVIRANGLEQLLTVLTMAAGERVPAGNRVAILSASGGGAVIISDQCVSLGLEVAELLPETRRALDEVLPAFASSANPIDFTAQLLAQPDMLFYCLNVVQNDPNVDMLIVNFNLLFEVAEPFSAQLVELYRKIDKPVITLGNPFGGSPEEMDSMFNKLRRAGIPSIGEIDNGIWAINEIVKWASRMEKGSEEYILPPPGSEKEEAMAVIGEARDGRLTEYRAAAVLKAYGIPVPRGNLARSADEASALAKEIGYPVVLKIQSPDILHKTDIGGLEINLSSEEEVRSAYGRICAAAAETCPGASIEGVLVQEMLPRGAEVIIGVKHDEIFGPVVMFGLGGVFVEVMEDVSFRVAPFTPHDAREMIREIRGYRILEGVRGGPPADLEALEETLLKVSRLAVELSDHIEEMDINPLFVFPPGGERRSRSRCPYNHKSLAGHGDRSPVPPFFGRILFAKFSKREKTGGGQKSVTKTLHHAVWVI